MRKFFFIISAIVAIPLLYSCGADSAMKKGDKFYALGEYYDAAAQYKKAYSQTNTKVRPLRGLRALKMADDGRLLSPYQPDAASHVGL